MNAPITDATIVDAVGTVVGRSANTKLAVVSPVYISPSRTKPFFLVITAVQPGFDSVYEVRKSGNACLLGETRERVVAVLRRHFDEVRVTNGDVQFAAERYAAFPSEENRHQLQTAMLQAPAKLETLAVQK